MSSTLVLHAYIVIGKVRKTTEDEPNHKFCFGQQCFEMQRQFTEFSKQEVCMPVATK